MDVVLGQKGFTSFNLKKRAPLFKVLLAKVDSVTSVIPMSEFGGPFATQVSGLTLYAFFCTIPVGGELGEPVKRVAIENPRVLLGVVGDDAPGLSRTCADGQSFWIEGFELRRFE